MSLSYTMRATLQAVADGSVVYDGLMTTTVGSPGTVSTLDALERRGLAKIDYAHPLPDPSGARSKPHYRKFPVVLTDAGREAVQ